MKTITNHKWYDFKYRDQVPDKVLKDQFGHLDDEHDTDNFFKYRGYWFHLSDFMQMSDKYWQGYVTEHAFSAVVIKLSNNCESYQIGRMQS